MQIIRPTGLGSTPSGLETPGLANICQHCGNRFLRPAYNGICCRIAFAAGMPTPVISEGPGGQTCTHFSRVEVSRPRYPSR